MRPRGYRNRLSLTACLAFALLTQAGGTAFGKESRSERFKRIASLTEPERERLARNFEKFKQISEPEREHYRKLHADLEADAAAGGDLQDVMLRYTAWLKTLDIGQREELRREKNPELRQEMVNRFRAEMQQKQQTGLATIAASPSPGKNGRSEGRQPLNTADLAAVMEVIENRLTSIRPPLLTPEQSTRLNQLSGASRYRFLFEVTTAPRVRNGPPPIRLFDQGFVNEQIAAISNPEQRKLLGSLPPPEQKASLYNMLAMSMFQKLRSELDDPVTLDKLLSELNIDEQAEVNSLHSEMRKQRIMQMLMRHTFGNIKGDAGFGRGSPGRPFPRPELDRPEKRERSGGL